MKAWCYSYMYILYSFPHSWDPSIANIFLAESMRLHHPKTGNSNLLCFKFNACCTTAVGWLRSYFGSKLCHRYNKLSHALQVGWFAFLGSLTGFSLSFLIILLVPQIFGPRVATGADGWLVQGDLEDWHVFKGFQRDSRGYRNRWNRLRNDRCHMISPRRFQVVTRHGGQPRQLRSYLSRVFWHKTHDASGFNSILGGNPRKKHFMSLSWTLGYPQNSPECCRVASLTHGILRFQILRHGQVLMPFSWDMMYWVRAQGSQGSQVALPP